MTARPTGDGGEWRCWRSECRVTCYYPDACSERAAAAAGVPEPASTDRRIRAICNEALDANRPPNATNSEVVWLAEEVLAALAAPPGVAGEGHDEGLRQRIAAALRDAIGREVVPTATAPSLRIADAVLAALVPSVPEEGQR